MFFPFLLRLQKRERPHASRRLFVASRPCPKGMSIFLCRRLSGKEKKINHLCVLGASSEAGGEIEGNSVKLDYTGIYFFKAAKPQPATSNK